MQKLGFSAADVQKPLDLQKQYSRRPPSKPAIGPCFAGSGHPRSAKAAPGRGPASRRTAVCRSRRAGRPEALYNSLVASDGLRRHAGQRDALIIFNCTEVVRYRILTRDEAPQMRAEVSEGRLSLCEADETALALATPL